MSKRVIKRKVDLEISDEPDSLSIKENNPKKKRAGVKKRLSRLEEYNEDEGRESSRNFQRWAEICESNTKGEAMKSKAFMKNFGVKVRKQTEKVRAYIQDQEKQLAENKDKLVENFRKIFSDTILSGESRGGSDGIPRATDKKCHFLFKDAEAIILGSHTLLRKFKETDEQLKSYKLELPTEKWKQDKQDMKELLACGREYGEKLVEKKLAPEAHPSHHPDGYEANDNENMASELFKDCSKELGGESWGTLAAEQVKRFTHVAKSIPFEGLE